MRDGDEFASDEQTDFLWALYKKRNFYYHTLPYHKFVPALKEREGVDFEALTKREAMFLIEDLFRQVQMRYRDLHLPTWFKPYTEADKAAFREAEDAKDGSR